MKGIDVDTKLIVAAGTAAGLAVGAVGGYFYAVKKLTAEYDEVFNETLDAELKQVQEHYDKRHLIQEERHAKERELLLQERRVPKPPVGVDAGDGLMEGPDEEILERIAAGLRRDDPADGTLSADRGAGIIGQIKPPLEVVAKRRSAPYMVTEQVYMDNVDGFNQVSLIYYTGDSVLADIDDNPIGDVEALVGLNNLHNLGSETVRYVCNNRNRTYYEINIDHRSYAEFVAGEISP